MAFSVGESPSDPIASFLAMNDLADLMTPMTDLVARGDLACRAMDGPALATIAVSLARQLPTRLELLAMQVNDLVDEDEVVLACQVWAHLSDALRTTASRHP
jgi:hypothetical protein